MRRFPKLLLCGLLLFGVGRDIHAQQPTPQSTIKKQRLSDSEVIFRIDKSTDDSEILATALSLDQSLLFTFYVKQRNKQPLNEGSLKVWKLDKKRPGYQQAALEWKWKCATYWSNRVVIADRKCLTVGYAY